jgi:predicted HD phosphohydrolase
MKKVRFIRKGAAAVVAALLVLSVGAASAQTQGMERRDEADKNFKRTFCHPAVRTPQSSCCDMVVRTHVSATSPR